MVAWVMLKLNVYIGSANKLNIGDIPQGDIPNLFVGFVQMPQTVRSGDKWGANPTNSR